MARDRTDDAAAPAPAHRRESVGGHDTYASLDAGVQTCKACLRLFALRPTSDVIPKCRMRRNAVYFYRKKLDYCSLNTMPPCIHEKLI